MCEDTERATMKPSIGRIVHWVSPDGVTCAAIITEVAEASVCLSVFPSHGDLVRCLEGVLYSEAPQADHWTWPPRV